MNGETLRIDDQAIEDQAIAWHLEMPHMPAARWEDLIRWLEQDDANRIAFERVAEADHLLGENRSTAPGILADIATGRGPAKLRKRAGIGLAMAAALVGVTAWTVGGRHAAPISFVTAAGAPRDIRLADGSTIALNGASRLSRDGADPRKVGLESGEAMFDVRHHADAPFEVRAANYRIVDLGTRFNVAVKEGHLDIAVAEGSVLFDPDASRITLTAGQAISVDTASGQAMRHKALAPGGWRNGDLVFEQAALADVADALHRRYGTGIRLTGRLPALPFTGNVHLSGEASRDIAHLARLIGADYRRDGEVWVLSSPGNAR